MKKLALILAILLFISVLLGGIEEVEIGKFTYLGKTFIKHQNNLMIIHPNREVQFIPMIEGISLDAHVRAYFADWRHFYAVELKDFQFPWTIDYEKDYLAYKAGRFHKSGPVRRQEKAWFLVFTYLALLIVGPILYSCKQDSKKSSRRIKWVVANFFIFLGILGVVNPGSLLIVRSVGLFSQIIITSLFFYLFLCLVFLCRRAENIYGQIKWHKDGFLIYLR